MKTLVIINDVFDKDTWKEYQVDNVCEKIIELYPQGFPPSARLYRDEISVDNDITPSTPEEVNRINEFDRVALVIYPEEATTIFLIVVLVVLSAVAFMSIPKVPNIASGNRNTNSTSSNNKLANRTNEARPRARIPDIYGEVISTPDLIAFPYTVYENNEQYEVAYMCVGRGHYQITDINDGDTLMSNINGASAQFYEPFTSPNNSSPYLQIGEDIDEDLISVVRSNEVNGQTLLPPNIKLTGDLNIKFVYPNKIVALEDSGINFSETFISGIDITISQADIVVQEAAFIAPSTVIPEIRLNFNGTYSVSSVFTDMIVLSNPSTAWEDLDDWDDDLTISSPIIQADGSNWVGNFTTNISAESYYFNFVASNGLYKDDGTNQIAENVDVEVELTPIDSNNNPIGSAETFQGLILGSGITRNERAITLKVSPTFTGRAKVRVRRSSDTDYAFVGNVADEVKWKDLYIVNPVVKPHFGNITTVLVKTKATVAALAIKDRKFNCIATRKLPARVSGSDFTTDLFATKNGADIISAISLDPQIGNRRVEELDFDSIYNVMDELTDYFCCPSATFFSYTFDKDTMSFEETLSSIASSLFSIIYRQGNVIKMSFEKEENDATMIFNHRNKIPDSETRVIRFGNNDEHDGVELEYIDEDDGASLSYFIPEDMSAINPRKVETIGIRTQRQAFWHAWRIWNKIKYQHLSTEFTATQEAATIILNEKVLIADNTRIKTQDGQINSQNGLELTLSQNVVMDNSNDYSIFIQHFDKTTENIPITVGSASNKIILTRPPRMSLAIADDLYSKATYIIVAEDNVRHEAFLINEKTSKNNYEYDIKASNYSTKYYQQDRLVFWQNLETNDISDKSPFGMAVVPTGDWSIIEDDVEGYVYNSGSTGVYTTDSLTFDSYCYIIRAKITGDSILIDNNHSLEVVGNSLIFKYDDEVVMSCAINLNTWITIALNYDEDEQTVELYVNGVLMDEGNGINSLTDGLILNNRLNGQFSDLRLYALNRSAQFIKDYDY